MKNIKLIKQLVFDALFLALIFVFSYTPYLGYITVGPLSFTTIHILVLIGAILFGYKRGALYGLFFGISSLVVALQYPGTLNYFSLNPFISILPRVLFGLISGAIFDLLRKTVSKKVFITLIFPLSGIFTLLHTILFFVAFYIFGVKDVFGITTALGLGSLVETLNGTYGGLMAFIGAYMSIGCVCEILGAALIVPSVYLAVNKKFKIGEVVTDQENKKYSLKFNLFTTLLIVVFAIISVIIVSLLG